MNWRSITRSGRPVRLFGCPAPSPSAGSILTTGEGLAIRTEDHTFGSISVVFEQELELTSAGIVRLNPHPASHQLQ
jgi:hypothetical protein